MPTPSMIWLTVIILSPNFIMYSNLVLGCPIYYTSTYDAGNGRYIEAAIDGGRISVLAVWQRKQTDVANRQSKRKQAFERRNIGYVVGHVKRDVILRVALGSVCRLIVG